MGEALFMRGVELPAGTDPGAVCEVHTWPIEKLMAELMDLLRARHGQGGLNVCKDCIYRAKQEADRRRGRAAP